MLKRKRLIYPKLFLNYLILILIPFSLIKNNSNHSRITKLLKSHSILSINNILHCGEYLFISGKTATEGFTWIG